jgi:hypothetical protein
MLFPEKSRKLPSDLVAVVDAKPAPLSGLKAGETFGLFLKFEIIYFNIHE